MVPKHLQMFRESYVSYSNQWVCSLMVEYETFNFADEGSSPFIPSIVMTNRMNPFGDSQLVDILSFFVTPASLFSTAEGLDDYKDQGAK